MAEAVSQIAAVRATAVRGNVSGAASRGARSGLIANFLRRDDSHGTIDFPCAVVYFFCTISMGCDSISGIRLGGLSSSALFVPTCQVLTGELASGL
jgi:hypothetical protein